MTFVHGQAGSSKILSAPAATEQPVSRLRARLGLTDSKTEPITEQLSNIENRLNKLESITGVKELSVLEKLPSNTEKPLTEQVSDPTKQVSQLTEQVNQLSEQLSKLTNLLKSEYVSRDTIETIATELTGKFELLHKEIVTTYNMSVIAIRESRESCENSLSKIEGQSTATSNELYELSKTVRHVQESVQANHTSINQLNAKLVSLEHTSSELENKVARVKNLTRRAPTGEIVGIQLNNKRERHFREYRTSEGLARPYRTKRDLILGNRWVDLAEPED
jgi:chromosome segregation ATPase